MILQLIKKQGTFLECLDRGPEFKSNPVTFTGSQRAGWQKWPRIMVCGLQAGWAKDFFRKASCLVVTCVVSFHLKKSFMCKDKGCHSKHFVSPGGENQIPKHSTLPYSLKQNVQDSLKVNEDSCSGRVGLVTRFLIPFEALQLNPFNLESLEGMIRPDQ